ncbi:RidA family protein, partial [Faecalibaculum rodentium]
FVYMSAQTGRGITFQEQAVTACYRVMDVLKDLDLRMDHLVKYTVYLTDMENRDMFLGVFKNFVEAPYPAVTIVQVAGLENDSMVAIEGQGVNTLRHERAMNGSSGCVDCES